MKRHKHSLSHYKLFSADLGQLIPISWQEILPGDTFQQSCSALVRAAALVRPVMHPMHVRIHHWFVPNRLNWVNWEKFITGGADGDQTPTVPTIDLTTPAAGSLANYLGVPLDGDGTPFASVTASALPFRAYNLIYNSRYRDEDLITELANVDTDGTDATSNTTLQVAAWSKDYFTAARDEPQKGTAPTIPMTGNLAIVSKTGVGAPALSRTSSIESFAFVI